MTDKNAAEGREVQMRDLEAEDEAKGGVAHELAHVIQQGGDSPGGRLATEA